jgi:WD40 repeat protein
MDTGKLMAGPFKSMGMVSAVQFSTDSKKLTLKSDVGKCVEVWDIEPQKFDARVGGHIVKWQKAYAHQCSGPGQTIVNKSILAAFSFANLKDAPAHTIYKFDASTLENIGVPFEEHTKAVTGLAPSFDGALLASAGEDDTIKVRITVDDLFQSISISISTSPDSSEGRPRVFLGTRLEYLALAVPSSSDCPPLSQASRRILFANPIVDLR